MFYLMMGFGSVWLLVTLYLVYLGLRQRKLETEMQTLREEIEAAEHKQH
ncbi:MAG: CcmD family protein [Caldilineaceae bacterium]|jgi:CcmD family protein|nr:CcmD family protein [Caldilineaceae bacterium]